MNMNIVDVVIVLAVLLFGLAGYFKGFIKQFADFIILVLSFLASLKFYSFAAAYLAARLSIPGNIAKVAAFFLVWVVFQFALNLIFYFTYPLVPDKVRSSFFNRTLGAIPGVLWGSVFITIFLTLFVAFPIESRYKDQVLASKSGSFLVEKSSGFEKYFANAFGGAINDTLTFLTIKPNSGETINLGYKTTKVGTDEESESRMLELVNKERKENGLKPLKMNKELQKVARTHSTDMFNRGYFAHVNPDGKDPFDRMSAAGIDFLVAGENLALAPNVQLAHEGLMNSPGHRANILTPEYAEVGIGCIDGGPYGKMFSQEFSN